MVGVLTITGALLRVLFINQFPPGLAGDEADMGLEARRILQTGWIGIWSNSGWGQPAGGFYWTAFLFSFLPDTNTILRLSTAIIGIATIPVFYLFVRTLYGKRPAVIATCLLVFSYWHIHYSRAAYTLTWVPLMESAILVFLGKGIKDRTTWPFVVSGVLAGIAIYTYRGYVFFPILLAGLWLFLLIRRAYPFKRFAIHAIAFALPFLLLAIPMVHFVTERYGDYMGHYKVLTSPFNSDTYKQAVKDGKQLQFMAGKVRRAVSVYYVGRGPDFTDGMGTKPLLDPITRGLFTIGFGVAIWHLRRWQYILILGGVAIGIFALATTIEWGENRRGIVALPMVFVAAGIGGHILLSLFERLFRRFVQPWRTYLRVGLGYPCLVAAFLFVAAWNSRVYFKDIGPSEMARFAYAYEMSLASTYLRSLQDENPYVYFYTPRWSWDYEVRRFVVPGLKGENRSREHGKFSLEKPADLERVVFLVMPPYDQYLPEIRRLYPGGQYHEVREDNRLLFAAYHIQGK
ncbi:MAG: glycosyltransferase family 39 protein [Dehalococcoidia bacterium]|nr:glycosyltransferase family 39 protein [Dehalococcoidia bacterium]